MHVVKPPQNLKFAILAVDSVLFTVISGQLRVLLMKVDRPPYYHKNRWGAPGGLIHPVETAEMAVERHLWEKVGARAVHLEQLATFSRVDRDPRGRVVSVAYLGLTPTTAFTRRQGIEARWFPADALPRLAYDHKEMIETAMLRLRAKLAYTNIAYALVPDEFTLGALQGVYEVILDRRVDKRNFRKKLFQLKLVVGTKKKRRAGRSRPAQLYRFRARTPMIVDIL